MLFRMTFTCDVFSSKTLVSMGDWLRRIGSVVSAWDLKVESLSPGRCTHVVFLGKTLNSHSASLHPGFKWEPAKLLGDNLAKCWEVTCEGLLSHPGGVEIHS